MPWVNFIQSKILYANSLLNNYVQFLYDIGVVSSKEPFKCLINQGLILGEVSKNLLEIELQKFNEIIINNSHYR